MAESEIKGGQHEIIQTFLGRRLWGKIEFTAET